MPFRWNPREHLALVRYVLKWLVLAVPVGIVIGAAVAGFLWSLDAVTRLRWATDTSLGLPWLLLLLPLAGVAIGAMYHLLGKSVEGGNNLIIDQIHEPGGGVPMRMAPLVLIGTVVTHLFGGSAGREGTAVQMGGSIASAAGRVLRLDRIDTQTLLMCGVAAGFGAVFGTPLTGAIFAVEVLAIGLVSFQAIVPCLIAERRRRLDRWRVRDQSHAILDRAVRGRRVESERHQLAIARQGGGGGNHFRAGERDLFRARTRPGPLVQAGGADTDTAAGGGRGDRRFCSRWRSGRTTSASA